tara:strand:- start:284 stop:1192 length:909 start_codon:yes stop_codon:yes gene_type:complete
MSNLDQNGGLRKKVFIKKHCAPGKDITDGSCLDEKLIRKVAKIVNKMRKRDKDLPEINCKESPKKIHGCVCHALKEITGCSSEACWLKIKTLMKHLGKDKGKFKESFKPIMPEDWLKDYNAWLGTDDIENCLEQHQKTDKSFYFYGAEPIDFSDCSVSNLCSFNMKKHLKKGQHKIGVVFNTDPHNKPGQHWMSLYMDLSGTNLEGIPSIYFFDSYGRAPGKEVSKLIEKVKKQGEDCNNPVKYFYNDKGYQNKDAQCGMYSIHFIKEMLKGVQFKDYLKSGLSDKLMVSIRDNYFIPPNEI